MLYERLFSLISLTLFPPTSNPPFCNKRWTHLYSSSFLHESEPKPSSATSRSKIEIAATYISIRRGDRLRHLFVMVKIPTKWIKSIILHFYCHQLHLKIITSNMNIKGIISILFIYIAHLKTTWLTKVQQNHS